MKKNKQEVSKMELIIFFSIITVIEFTCIFIFDETVFASVGMFIWYLVDTISGFIRNKEDKYVDFIFCCLYFGICIFNILYLMG